MDISKTDSGVCVDGFTAGGAKEGRYGVAIIAGDKPCRAAAVFTTNTMKAAPILLSMEKVAGGELQAVIANSGNANACVAAGMDDAKKMCEIAAKMLSLSPDKVAVASTGIIGRKMDIGAIEKVADKVSKDLTDKPVGSLRAAKAIMTTDTREKSLSFKYKGIEAGGICKGAGMISPQMATMLCFITTDADVDPKTLQECLRNAVGDSFNMLVIDDCMSTNDMVLLLSSGKVKCAKEDFQTLLNHLTKELAKLLALDGEGATKYIEVEVRGAKDRETARKAAKAIISSSLVKTAVHGENPNWGRIAAAMGSVIKYDFEKIDLFFESGSEKAAVVVKGVMKELEPARKILKNKELRITVDLNSGKESAVGYGCDLTCEYIKINAEYN